VNIRRKILLAFGVPTLATVIMGVVLFQGTTQNLRTADRVRHAEDVIGSAHALFAAAIDAETGVRGFVITSRETFLEPFNDGLATFNKLAPRLRTLVSDNPEQVARVDRITRLHARWLDETATREISHLRSGDPEAARQLVLTGIGKQLVDELRGVVDEFIQTEQLLLRSRIASSDAALKAARAVLFLGIGIVVAMTIMIALALSRRLSKNAKAVAAAAEGLADGDLTRRAEVRTHDEIGELATSFNTMAEQLETIIGSERHTKEALEDAVREYSEFAARVALGDLTARVTANGSGSLQTLSDNLNGMVTGLAQLSSQVGDGAQSIGMAASEILAAVSEHTASANEQSAAINQVSTTVNEVRAAAEQSAGKAKEVADQAQASTQVSEEGTESVLAIARGMEQIRERVEAMAADILALSEQTQHIGDITTTVNDLADQSNILALNASIEAAKAGEQGKGFAIVAGEVRNLAEQSKEATTQIRGILGDVQKATTAAVLATERGSKVVEEGLVLSSLAADTIGSLGETIRGAAHAAQQIAASAHEQRVGMDQVAQAMKDVNDATTQFVAGAEQSQRAAEELNGLASRLGSLTEPYQL
jgi:methyl-accepting chemotaxis protein